MNNEFEYKAADGTEVRGDKDDKDAKDIAKAHEKLLEKQGDRRFYVRCFLILVSLIFFIATKGDFLTTSVFACTVGIPKMAGGLRLLKSFMNKGPT